MFIVQCKFQIILFKQTVGLLKLITEWDRQSAGILLFTLCYSPVMLTIRP